MKHFIVIILLVFIIVGCFNKKLKVEKSSRSILDSLQGK